MADRKRTLRCAIYTRKSSEEGLEQDFNSLDAQREACEAYVASQKSEGWALLRDHYDDGGFSGGTLERPALQQLLADIEDGRVDVIVVYKIDRLSRSLMDFAKLVEVFDRKGVTFVSVTQAFNTTTSMGRLTLNILLSFAQFEREVTGERIRDKIAASKKKGLWMGGFVPFGYNANERTLAINESEAAIVRSLFDLYLEHGTVPTLEAEAARRGYATRRRDVASGKSMGGRPFSRGHLYKILTNPLYIGIIEHKGVHHRGQHPALIDSATWDAVQERLRANTQGGKRIRGNVKESALLAGLLFDEDGHALRSTHTVKRGRRYRYYATQPADGDKPPFRLSASEIEPVVLHQIRAFLEQPARLVDALDLSRATPDTLNSVIAAGQSLAETLQVSTGQRDLLVELIDRVTVGEDALLIALNQEGSGRAPRRRRAHHRATPPPSSFRHRCASRVAVWRHGSSLRATRPSPPALPTRSSSAPSRVATPGSKTSPAAAPAPSSRSPTARASPTATSSAFSTLPSCRPPSSRTSSTGGSRRT